MTGIIFIPIGAILFFIRRYFLIRYFNVGKIYKSSPEVDDLLVYLIPYIKKYGIEIESHYFIITIPGSGKVQLWNVNKWYGWLSRAESIAEGKESYWGKKEI